MLEREGANFLRQIDGVAANQRTESAAAATELRDARGAVAGATGALLRIHFLAGSPDFSTTLGLVRAALTLGELPVDAALDDIGPRLKAEDRIRQLDRSGFLPFEGGDLHFHITRPPSQEQPPRAQEPRPASVPPSARISFPPWLRTSPRRFR